MLPADRPAPSTTPGARAGDPQRRRADDEAAEGGERRKSGRRRRASDRLFDRATRSYPQTEALSQVRNLENLILFIDDDLRETALGLRHIEDYLIQALCLLERPRLTRTEVQAVATDGRVLEHVDSMVETLESLRRRLARLAASLR
ncbi:MAG: hypothetical protein KC486_11295 [Myxococcales bacterium]|nr:hypothetical protein [Myxococcales bacterium]